MMVALLRINGDQWGTKGATTGIGPESGIVDGESPSISLSYIDKESTNVRIQVQSCIYGVLCATGTAGAYVARDLSPTRTTGHHCSGFLLH